MNQASTTPPASSSQQGGRVLVLAPDENMASAILAALREAAPGAQADVAHSLEEAQQLVVHQRPDLFVLDVDATYDLGQEFLYDLRTSHPNARAIVLTAIHLAAHRAQAAGLGAIHFLEKPFPHSDFVTLVEALLQPGGEQEGEKFQGTLSDLHIADIIQLKCMSGTTSILEFTGPRGEKPRVYFEHGQVTHATSPGKEGVSAFNEIVDWKGGMISEVSGAGQSARTIDLDWQILLMEAVRKIDETRGTSAGAAEQATTAAASARKVLVIDDSAMLLNFVNEILAEAKYEVTTAPTAHDGLRMAASESPHLILLDYVLPDMKGDEVLARLLQQPTTAATPVVYISGFGSDLQPDPNQNPNIVGSLNKPFTSELLLKTVETYMPQQSAEPTTSTTDPGQPIESGWAPADNPDAQSAPAMAAVGSMEGAMEPATAGGADATIEAAAGGTSDPWWSAAPPPAPWQEPAPETFGATAAPAADDAFTVAPESVTTDPFVTSAPAPAATMADIPIPSGAAYFCGDTSFFSLNWALHAIATQRLTGTLRCFSDREPVELLARNGQILLVTTRDPDLYCSESPITLVHVDAARTEQARQEQRDTSRPLFITLAQQELIIREPAMQLVQHYGQKLFAQLWTAPRVRFMFEQTEQLPDWAQDVPAEEDVDHWALATLRFIQSSDLSTHENYDPASIPAYTRDGFMRVQRLRLTVAEAQFASQFNGAREIAQIAKNLRLDFKFARMTLFRFLALEIVECWPPTAAVKTEKRGVFGRIFGE
ncbi:MAG: response regulator [Verrucomicrobiota bacterium]|nr:response regulator [Verrucomicrobiota bacterium]